MIPARAAAGSGAPSSLPLQHTNRRRAAAPTCRTLLLLPLLLGAVNSSSVAPTL